MGLPPDTRTSNEFGTIEPHREDPSDDAPIAMGALRKICMAIHEPRESNTIDLHGSLGNFRADVASEILYQGPSSNTFALLRRVRISEIWEDSVGRSGANDMSNLRDELALLSDSLVATDIKGWATVMGQGCWD